MRPNIKLSKPQSAIFNCQKRHRIAVCGRRFGKTRLAVPELMRCALSGKDKIAIYCSPTWRQSREDIWAVLKEMSAPYWGNKIPNETNLEITIIGGSKILLRGANNFESLRGGSCDLIIFDEYADIDPAAWTSVMRPKLADRQGRALFIGTPKAGSSGHFKELWDKSVDPLNEPYWGRFSYTTLDGGWVTQDELEQSMLDMSEKEFKSEYYASWETLSGQVYYAFNPDLHAKKLLEFNPKLPIFWSLDFNVHPMCSVIGQIVEENLTHTERTIMTREPRRDVYILRELHLENSNTPEACAEFMKLTKPWLSLTPHGHMQVFVYGDATASRRQTSGGGSLSDWEAVRQAFASHPEYYMNYLYKGSNPAVKDRVASVNAKFKNAKGDRSLFIDPTCRHLIKDLNYCSWIPGVTVIDPGKDRMMGHISDALGYVVETEFGLRAHGGWRQEYLA